MKSSNQIELTAGIFLLLGIGALVFLSIQATDAGSALGSERYRVTATFTNVGGLKEGARVTMAGVTVGTVERIELDQQSLQARVTLAISQRYDDLPEDTSASIYTSGILGDQYVSLEPGGSLKALKDGDELMITQSAVVLEQLIGKYLFSSKEQEGGDSQ